jgi:urease accessory protein
MAGITIMFDAHPRFLRLMHLVSPSLPTGAFAYSQGLEWAVEAGWVKDAADLQAWLADLIQTNLTRVDVPLLKRMMDACQESRNKDLAGWCDRLLALRESDELRMEEKSRGRAMVSLWEGLALPMGTDEKQVVETSQLAGFALAATRWRIPPDQAAAGYLWSWLENQVLAGIKIIPLGQTEGHRLLLRLDPVVMKAVASGLLLEDNELGASSPALAIASSRHETQYTRLYRS